MVLFVNTVLILDKFYTNFRIHKKTLCKCTINPNQIKALYTNRRFGAYPKSPFHLLSAACII